MRELGATVTAAERCSRLALSFPTLALAPGAQPFDAEKLDAWARSPAPSSGAVHAARFVLGVWNAAALWRAGRFDVVAAVSVWDRAHREAFASWASSPWTA